MASGLCGATPFLVRSNSNRFQAIKHPDVPKNQKEVAGMIIENSCSWAGNLMLMVELQKKIMTFRDIIDLPPCDGSAPTNEVYSQGLDITSFDHFEWLFMFRPYLVMGTVKDLRNAYPNVVPLTTISDVNDTSVYQGLAHLNGALGHVICFWARNHRWIVDPKYDSENSSQNINLEQMGERVLGNLDFMIKAAKRMLDAMDEDDESDEGRIRFSSTGNGLTESDPGNKVSYSQPLLLPLRLQAVGKLIPISLHKLTEASARGATLLNEKKRTAGEREELPFQETKRAAKEVPAIETERVPVESKANDTSLQIPNVSPTATKNAPPPPPSPPPNSPSQQSNFPTNLTTPPPTPPILPSKGSPLAPPPPMPPAKGGGAPPPPPPLGAAKSLHMKKPNTKLRRSTHMGNLYRVLKGKVEGSSLNGKKSLGRKSNIGGGVSGKQGMADALAEMIKRSAHFQQIEADVEKHGTSIMEIKSAINSFQTKDKAELLKFHKHVEQHLEELTDETQVLARFEGFPMKKLESLRMAAALCSKLEGNLADLENWKVVPPLNQLLDKIESYYNKIKGEIDALERSKDEDSKRFQSHNIHFDFTILVRIKESMVDVSSGCMELALKERREMKAATAAQTGTKAEGQRKACVKMLWRAFQLAFRIYSFAGGHDDRADQLSKELAQEIETDPQHQS